MRRRPGRSGDQFVVALDQVGHAAFADRHAAPGQLPMDLRDAAMLAIAQGAGQRDHVHHAAAAPGLLPLPAAMPDGIAHSSGSHSAGSSGAPGPIPAATRWPDGCCSGSASPGRIPDRHTGAEPGFARPPALLGTRTVTSPAPRSNPPDSLNRQPVLPFLKKIQFHFLLADLLVKLADQRLAVLLSLAAPFLEEAPSASCRFHSFTSVG